MQWYEFCMARVSPRVRPGMRTSSSCPIVPKQPRSGNGAGGGNGGAGADTVANEEAGADTGAAPGIAVATFGGWMYT